MSTIYKYMLNTSRELVWFCISCYVSDSCRIKHNNIRSISFPQQTSLFQPQLMTTKPGAFVNCSVQVTGVFVCDVGAKRVREWPVRTRMRDLRTKPAGRRVYASV